MFSHLLITRFNLKNPNWVVTKNNEALLDDQWMQERMELFKNYCLPSILNQTNKNFKWLLFFDSSTDEKFRKSITELVNNHNFIEVLYIDGMPNFNKRILEYIEKNIKEIPYLITSRIDNDDCISNRFIEEVQKNFNKQDFMAFDYIQGYTLQIEPQIILGKKEPRVTQITDKRIWMSIIHEKNKVNEFDGYGNIDWNSINKEFILSEKMNEVVKTNILPFNRWWFKSLRNFLYVKMVLFSKKFKKAIGIYKVK